MTDGGDRSDKNGGKTTPLGIPRPEKKEADEALGRTTPLGPRRDSRIKGLDETGVPLSRPSSQPAPALPPTVAARSRQTGGRGGMFGNTFGSGDILSGRYEVVRFLAKGGMGEVYEAKDLELKEVMALKTIRPDIAGEGEVLQRFKREIQLARRVSHPNVCRIFDLFHHEIPGDPPIRVAFLTMELLRGDSLADRLQEREEPMSPEEVLPILRQMAGALDAAHDLGIVHRDLKSGNVMLVPAPSGRGDRVVITDFGLAKGGGSSLAATLTVDGAAMGTPAYMAPEQIEGDPITPAVDIYALGVMLFEMVTGTWPFLGDTALSTAIKRLKEPPPSPRKLVPDLDVRWEKGILRCLERDPSQRFQRASELVEYLAGGEMRSAPGGGAAARLRKGPGWKIAAGIGGALVLAAALVLPRFFGPEQEKPESSMAEAETVVVPIARPSTPVRPSFAVMRFKDLDEVPENDWLAAALPEMLASELAAGGQLRRVSGEDVARASIELDLAVAPTLGTDSLTHLHEILGADRVVSGGYLAEEGGRVRVDASLQDANSGETVTTVSETGDPAQLLELVGRVGAGLRTALGVEELSEEMAGEVAAALPRSEAAARDFAEGLEHLRAFDAQGAKERLLRAAAEDPASPRIHAALASAWSALGHDAEARAAIGKAMSAVADLSRQDQLQIEALSSELTYQWPRAVEIYKSLREFYPDDLESGLAQIRAQIAAGDSLAAEITLEALHRLPPAMADDPRVDLAEADIAGALSDYSRQRRAAEKAVEEGSRRGAQLLVARARLAQAEALRHLGDLAGARTAAGEAREILDAAGDRIGVGEAVNLIATTHYLSGDLGEAETLWKEFLSICQGAGQRTGEARALNNLALIEERRGERETAMALNNRSLQLRRELGDRSGEAMSLNNIANIVREAGKLEEAEKLYRESLDLRREIGEEGEVATSLNNLATLLAGQGRLDEAWKLLEEALEIKRKIGEKTGVAMALNNLAGVLHRRGELAEAASKFEESLAIKREIGEKSGVARAVGNLAEVTLEIGDPREAEKYFQEAMKLSEELGDEAGMADVEQGLAEVYALRGYLDDARRSLNQALARRTQLGDAAGVARSRWALAVLALDEGRPEETERAALQALDGVSPDDVARVQEIRAVLAEAQLAQGDTAGCAATLQRALAIPEEPSFLSDRMRMEILAARLLAPQDLARAVEALEGLAKRAEEASRREVALRASFARAQVEAEHGDPELAQTLFGDLADSAKEAGFGHIAKEAAEASGQAPRGGRRARG